MGKNNYKFKREDVVLMLYDIGNYTKICYDYEKRGLHEEVCKFIDMVITSSNDIIKDYGGKLHEFTGDGFLSSFNINSQKEAIEASFRIQETMQTQRNAGYFNFGKDPNVRIALYAGPSIFLSLGGDMSPVGVAPSTVSRIESRVSLNNIMMGGDISDVLHAEYNTELIENQYLRGISENIKLYLINKNNHI